MQPWSPPPRVCPPPTSVRSSYEARNVWGPDPAPVVASLGTDTERRRAAVGDMLHALSCRRRCRTSGTVLAEPVVADQAGRRAADTAHGSQIAEYQAPQRYRGPCARQLLCRCCRHLGADGIGWPNCQPRRYYCCCTHCARLPVIHCAPCTRGERRRTGPARRCGGPSAAWWFPAQRCFQIEGTALRTLWLLRRRRLVVGAIDEAPIP